ncbi:hypothetical protein [Kitasatospora sp. NPDC058046]|uniref:hypothetical protein n=1 Tax=Kitasatospora sp. NPDC058046 TaxID=3346312 RepID=UPI0036DD48A0
MPEPAPHTPAVHSRAVTVATRSGPAARWVVWTDREALFCYGCHDLVGLAVDEPPVHLTPRTLSAPQPRRSLQHSCGTWNVPPWHVVTTAEAVPAAAAELATVRSRNLAALRAELRRRTAVVLRRVVESQLPPVRAGYPLDLCGLHAHVETDDRGWHASCIDPESPGPDSMIEVRTVDLPCLLPGYLPASPPNGPTVTRLPGSSACPQPYEGPRWAISDFAPSYQDCLPPDPWRVGDILRVEVLDRIPRTDDPQACGGLGNSDLGLDQPLGSCLHQPTEPHVPADAPGYERLSPGLVTMTATVVEIEPPEWCDVDEEDGYPDEEMSGWMRRAWVRPSTTEEADALLALHRGDAGLGAVQ